MRFAEIAAGQVIAAGPETITERQILEFAREFDPQWFHTDPARAAASTWNGLIASGWQTCAIAMRMVVSAALTGSESFGSPGLAYLKWESPVRPGDELRLVIDVLDKRVATKRPTLGIVRWRWRLFNQRGETVLDLEATSLFDLAATGAD
ncbi:MAG: MaoC family dehydratase [Casimicrobiaceae bacterium]